MSSNAKALPIVNRPPAGVAAAILGTFALVVIVLFTQSLTIALGAIAGCAFLAFLFFAPTFWLAILLLVLIPFQSLLTQLSRDFGPNAQQIFAVWKELLLLVGIVRVISNNPRRRDIITSNRWVLAWSGLLIAVYCITFIRFPSVPAIFSLNLETRFVGVMLFFMFLDMNEDRTTALLRVIVCSVGLVALYGLVQYAWDYDRLLPLVAYAPNMLADDIRRLYSYSLNPFDPSYAAVIAILILFSGAARWRLERVIPFCGLLLACVVLTYARSAYLALLCGIAVACMCACKYAKRIAVLLPFAVCLLCVLALAGNGALPQSNLGRRIYSIKSQQDDSSVAHKERMARAVDLIFATPFGIGLGQYGAIEARFSGGVLEAHYAENWILQVGVQNGLAGAFVYLALTLTIILVLLRIEKKASTYRDLQRIAALSVFVAMSIAGIMIPVWDFLLPVVYVWALVGLTLGCRTNASAPARHNI